MNYKSTLKIVIVSLLFVFSISEVSAQAVQKIGSNSFTINPKAVLELESTSKGFLPPRMTTTDLSNMGTTLPAGLIVYVTNAVVPGLQIWNGTGWVVFVDAAALAAEVTRATGVEGTLTTNVTSNTSSISALQSEQTTQNSAIALNTAKTGITTAQAATIAATTGTNTGDQDISGIATNATALAAEVTRATAAEVKLTAEKEDTANKSTSIAIGSTSNIKFPTEKAVIDYVNVKTNNISIAKKIANYTILDSDSTILCDTSAGTFKLTLPSVSGSSGKIYVIRKIDASNIELTFDALTFTDGVTVTSLNYAKTLRVQSNGTSWYIID